MSFITRSSITRLGVAALALLAALGLLVVVGGSTARATLSDGDVVLGSFPATTCTPGTNVNCSNTTTGIVSPGGANALVGQSTGIGAGVSGISSGGNGVHGQSSTGPGVFGETSSGIGVDAFSDTGNGLEADSNESTGALLQSHSQSGAGAEVEIHNTSNGRGALEATTDGTGPAVHGVATSGSGVEGFSTSGAAVRGHAQSASATAIKAEGKTTFSRSGKLTISAGSSQATKSAINLTTASLVLTTIQGNQAGVYVQGGTKVTGTSGSFTIHLNKNATANLSVAWFVVN
jgi:hypothetical protein